MSKAVSATPFGFLVSAYLVLTSLSQTGGAVQAPVSAEMMRLGSRGIRVHDPFSIVQDGNLFWDFYGCCQGANSTYNIRVGRSERITGPYRDREGRDVMQDGGSLLLGTEGNLIGPGHAGIFKQRDQYWFSFHFYDGSDRGASKLAIRPMAWDSNGWPKIGSMN